MSDEWAKYIVEVVNELIRHAEMGPFDVGIEPQQYKSIFRLGAEHGRAYELKRSAELVEKLKAIIWAYENNVG